MKKLFSLFLFISFFSCKEENKEHAQQANTNKAFETPIILTPGKDTIKLPIIVSSSAFENPKVIQIPTKDGGFYTKKKKDGTEIKIDLKKAITIALDILTPQGIPHFTNFTTNDGLALDAISCSTLDKTGNLWFGTQGGGVSRYDGKTFTNYTTAQGLANNMVFSITEDKTGNLWFGTDGGVSKYDGKSFSTFTDKEGLANNTVWSILEDKSGNLWFGTQGGGVSRYDGKMFTNYTTAQGLANNVVFSITEDKTGNLWFGTQGGGVSRLALSGVEGYDGKTFTNYTTAQGLANNLVRSITEDKTGNLWFGTDGGGVSRYDGKTFTNYTTAQGLANNEVFSITEDKTGNLWFGTYGGGVSRYDGKTFTNYTTAQGLASNVVLSITEDKTGNLWFGTQGGGVSRLSLSGVEGYNGKTFTNYTTAQGLANNVVLSITEDKTGNLWFGTQGDGVSRYDGKTFTNYTTAQGLANNVVLSITEDKTGNLWFGTDGGGVSRYDGKTFTNYTTAQGLANNVVFSITEDKTGNFWFGTYGGGVSRYDGKTFTNYTTAQGLANNEVLSITEDKTGNLWFGTYGGGVSRYDGKTFTNYTTAQGLPDNAVTQVVIDKNGKNIIIATNFGVVAGVSFTPKLPYKSTKKALPFQNNLNNDELTTYYDLVLETYNSSTGYPVKDVNTGQNCLFQDSKGIYWAGTGSDATALVRIDFDALNRNPKPPAPVLYKIKLNEENICYYSLSSLRGTKQSQPNLEITSGENAFAMTDAEDSTTLSQQEIITYGKALNVIGRDSLRKKFAYVEFDGITQFYPIPQNLVLPYEHNNVTFEFNAVQLSRAHLLNFQYMLEGYDKTWSPVLKKREATFGNINEGTYTFKLKSQYTGPDGNNAWSEVLTYTFKVLPPWYRTWWMYTIYFLCLMSFVFGLVSANSKRLRAKAIELQLKVDKATHEIKEQKNLIEEKQKEILDSINYAKRIQYSLLASDNLLKENLPNHFLFFKPKDVVSGDFYWAAPTGSATNRKFIIVTADSTGHGVPGAIMSMLNISCLNESINADKLTQPSDILNATRKKIIEHLLNDGSVDGGKDGMDCSLISFDFKNKKLIYAAANNPVWIIRDKTLIVLEADRMPIGKHDKDSIPFTQHEFDLQAGDVVYTLTDGFPDQFGGPKGKKFMYKQLENLLISISHESMEVQKQKLEDVFENWKGDLEQVDDVCVIGVKI